MREILFRGKKDIVKNKSAWMYGFYYFIMDMHYIVNDGVYTPCIPETVGQYTGLLDKNRKKLFEGDIVKTKQYNHSTRENCEFICFVEFERVSPRFVLTSLDKDEYSYCFSFATAEGNELISDGIEIVGNIHDNPELLEESEVKI
jgi:uncharacterized phage protein (TIGR01671 family)